MPLRGILTTALLLIATHRTAQAQGSSIVHAEVRLDLSGLQDSADSTNLSTTSNGVRVGVGEQDGVFLSRLIAVPISSPKPFLAVAAVWTVENPQPSEVTVSLRSSRDGISWTDWESVPPDDVSTGIQESVGSLSFLPKETTLVQFRVTLPRGTGTSSTLTRFRGVFISPGESASTTAQASPVTPIRLGTPRPLAVAKPPVVTRTGWGCPDGQSSPSWTPEYTTVKHLIVHHTDNTNSQSDWPAVIRSIFTAHKFTNGWGDIGYNYLVDPNGIVYEGRAGGDNVQGAHFSCANGNTMGIAFLGTFTSVQPTQSAWNAVTTMLAWKAEQRGIDPSGTTYHTGSQLTLYNISGHRDANSTTAPGTCPKNTACPGNALYPRLPALRNDVAALISPASSPTIQVTSPNGGETWTVGTPHSVTWTASGLNQAGQLYVLLSKDGGQSVYVNPIAVLSPGATSHSWTPVSGHITTAGRVGVGNLVNGSYQAIDWSNQNFTIAAQPTSATVPTVTTTQATNVGANSATFNATINSDGGSSILERRFEWGIYPAWTTATNLIGASVTVSGNNFSYTATALAPSTTYQFRAWARNSIGWAVGGGLTFTTLTASDSTLPSISISSPTSSNSYPTSTTPVGLGGTASDNVGVTQVTCRNAATAVSVTASGTTSWSCGVTLIAGGNIITVTARDAAGNQGTDTITVSYTPLDTSPPTLTITGPTTSSAYPTSSTPISLSGNAGDNTGVTEVTCNNITTGNNVTAGGTTNWSCNIDLVSGNNSITVTARDAANNQGSDSIVVTFTPTNNPVPSITSVTPGSVEAGGPAFSLTVDGTGFIASSGVRWNGAAKQTAYVSSTRLNAAIDATDIASSGTASVTVDNPPPGGGTSSGMGVTITPPSTQCSPTAVTSCPFTVGRSLTTSSCTAGKQGSSHYTDTFSFAGTLGANVVIDLTASFDTYLYLVAPDGTIAALNDDSSGTTNSQIVATLNVAGTWTIEATTYYEWSIGPYTLSFSGCGGGSPPAAPSGLAVTYNHALVGNIPGINLNWTGVPDAVDYEAEINGYVLDLRTSGTSGGIYGLSEPACYAVRLRAVSLSGQRSGWSGRDIATSIIFSNDPLISGATLTKAAHLNELRAAVDTVRSAAGLPAYSFTNTIAPGTLVRAMHMLELRNALNDALNALGLAAVVFPDPAAGVTIIRASDPQRLRDAMK